MQASRPLSEQVSDTLFVTVRLASPRVAAQRKSTSTPPRPQTGSLRCPCSSHAPALQQRHLLSGRTGWLQRDRRVGRGEGLLGKLQTRRGTERRQRNSTWGSWLAPASAVGAASHRAAQDLMRPKSRLQRRSAQCLHRENALSCKRNRPARISNAPIHYQGQLPCRSFWPFCFRSSYVSSQPRCRATARQKSSQPHASSAGR